MKFEAALHLMRNNKKVIRRKAWDNNIHLSGPKSCLTIEDSLADDWEVVEVKMSSLKAGEKFHLGQHSNESFTMLKVTHLYGPSINTKHYYYFDTKKFDLFYSAADLVVERIT